MPAVMGRSHDMTGLTVGSLTVAGMNAVGMAVPAPVGAFGIGVCAGASLLPDIDTITSTVSHALGPVTRGLSRVVSSLSLSIYHVTRGPNDSPDRENPHRLITHVPVGAVSTGLLVALVVIPTWSVQVTSSLTIHSWMVTSVLLGLLVSLAAAGWPDVHRALAGVLADLFKWRADGQQFLCWVLFAAALAGGFFVVRTYPSWLPLYPVMVTIGCHIHREGDWCTVQGVPRRSWPKMVDGERWDSDSWSRAWSAGDHFEQGPVTITLVSATAVSLTLAVGVFWPLVTLMVSLYQTLSGHVAA